MRDDIARCVLKQMRWALGGAAERPAIVEAQGIAQSLLGDTLGANM